MKRFKVLSLAIFMVLAFSATAFAANQVFVKTTVPNIPKSSCYQAGTDTFEFDSLSTMQEGDVITITLNNLVTVCKALNFFVTFANTAGALDTTGTLPVSTTAGAITAAAAGQQWGFLVQAPAGSQIITLTLRQVISASGALAADTNLRMTFTGVALTDKLVVKLFDGKGVATFATSGIQKYNSATTFYDTAIVAGDNTLCIDTLTQNFTGEYVVNTPNSAPELVGDKLNFSGDYTIAHIMSAVTYGPVTCKGANCGNIVLGAALQTNTCVAFDYETNGNNTNGYCTNHSANTGYLPKFILQASSPWDLVPYSVRAEILVNGLTGERGVYWSSTAPSYKTSATSTCGTPVGATAFAPLATYLRGDGITGAVPVAPMAANCSAIAAAAKAVIFTAAAQNIFVGGDYFFELNFPPFNYNLSEVNAGDVVTVRVTLTKGTCGAVTQDICIGTFGCPSAPTPAPGTSSILCPYVTGLAAGDTYWNGIALVNTAAVPATVALTAYKADGTSATATETVPARGIVAKLVNTITWTGTTPSGVPAYITATASNATATVAGFNAFVFMSDSTTTTDSNSMGYLCKSSTSTY